MSLAIGTPSDNRKQRQQEEVEAIKAIYENDVQIEVDPKSEKYFAVILLHLRPSQGLSGEPDVYASVDLVVKCGLQYPDSVPEISCHNAKGISDEDVSLLCRELNDLANKLSGEEMVLQFAQHVQQFLHKHNQQPSKSFYEEMLTRQKLQAERNLAKKEQELILQYETFEQQLRLRQEQLNIELEETQFDTVEMTANFDSTVARASASGDVDDSRTRSSSLPSHSRNAVSLVAESMRKKSDEDVVCEKNHGASLVVYNIRNQEQNVYKGQFHFSRMDKFAVDRVGMLSSNGQLITITEWNLKWRRSLKGKNSSALLRTALDPIEKQLESIQKESQGLCKLEPHAMLISFLCFDFVLTRDCILISLVKENANALLMSSFYLDQERVCPLPTLKSCCNDILTALAFLHSKSIVHRDLGADCIHMCPDVFKLSDYSITKRVRETVLYLTSKDFFSMPLAASRKYPLRLCEYVGVGKPSKKQDIYLLGLVMLQLFQGKEELGGGIPIIPADVPADLSDFLCHCITRSEQERWYASQLLEHRFVQEKISEKGLVNGGLLKGHNAFEPFEAEHPIPPYVRDSLVASRLQTEFDVQECLGSGAFGYVLRVRNKLDGGVYAIKRILLNPKNKHLTKKIVREVKLLSRMNHENVVRYYNSWIENTMEHVKPISDTSSVVTRTTTTDENPGLSKKVKPKDLVLNFATKDPFQDKELSFAQPAPQSSEWDDVGSKELIDASSSSESSSANVFGTSFYPHVDSVSEDVVFEGGKESESSEAACDVQPKRVGDTTSEESKDSSTQCVVQYLYIQMEYCEKSTIRRCIDCGELYGDHKRAWRFFREILEGLAHIHGQGMIHRDLKPMNIFLDAQDHAKIGDFGLANTTQGVLEASMSVEVGTSDRPLSPDHKAASLTGQVGTALYVSPELYVSVGRVNYSNKVDIYSLGIILFELFSPPLGTGMERVKVLTALRQPNIDIPREFLDNPAMIKQVKLLRSLLNHMPEGRPTAEEILNSDLLPQEELEETEFQKILRNTLADSQTRLYKSVISTVLAQQVPQVEDYIFDQDFYKSFSEKYNLISDHVQRTLSNILSSHGAVKVLPPLCLPQSSWLASYEQPVDTCKLLNQSGQVVALPHDLRLSFARFIARSNLSTVKRYCIDRVYRNPKRNRNTYSCPREIVKCDFDVVTGNSSAAFATAECLYFVLQVIEEFPVLKDKSFSVQINHLNLVKAVLFHCEVDQEQHTQVLKLLGDKPKKFDRQMGLRALGLSEQWIEKILHFLHQEGPYNKVASSLRSITSHKSKRYAAELAKQALRELEAVVLCAEEFLGSQLPITVALAFVYNLQEFCGVVFQVVGNVRQKGSKIDVDTLAVGGRYDDLITKFRKPIQQQTSVNQAVVGVSLLVDLICTYLNQCGSTLAPCDVLVCSSGAAKVVKDVALVKLLWAANIRAHHVAEPVFDVDHVQETSGIKCVVILKESEAGTASVKLVESIGGRSKSFEHKVDLNRLIPFLQDKGVGRSVQSGISTAEFTSEAREHHAAATTDTAGTQTSVAKLNISFAMAEKNEKLRPLKPSQMTWFTKQRITEARIANMLGGILPRFAARETIEVVACDVPGSVIKYLAAYLDLKDEKAFRCCADEVLQKHAKFKQQLDLLFDIVANLKLKQKCNILVLYGTSDDVFKVLL